MTTISELKNGNYHAQQIGPAWIIIECSHDQQIFDLENESRYIAFSSIRTDSE